nr:MAG TPA: hypothetical protein [Caudoviricetes sp.]
MTYKKTPKADLRTKLPAYHSFSALCKITNNF